MRTNFGELRTLPSAVLAFGEWSLKDENNEGKQVSGMNG